MRYASRTAVLWAAVAAAAAVAVFGDGGPGAGADGTPLPLTLVSATATTLTVSWTAPVGAEGYVFKVDGARRSNTWNGALTSATFQKAPDTAQHRYEVEAVTQAADGAVSYPPPAPTPPPPASACTSTITPTGNLQTFIAALPAGGTGCLTAGTYNASLTLAATHGTATAPVTVTSADPTRPATIFGRLVTKPGADNIRFTHLVLSWNGAGAGGVPSVTVGSSNVTFDHDDISNGNTVICVDLINDATYGTARNTVVSNSRIHNCGPLPYGSTNRAHGLYVSGVAATITGNWIYDNADRGVQLRGSQNAVVAHNVIDGNGEGIIFGDLPTANNDVYGNVIADSRVRWLVEAYWGSTTPGSGNTVHGNCLWPTNATSGYDANGGLDGGAGYAADANVVANPGYPRGGDFVLPAGSPCAGYGPAAVPGP